MQVCDDDACCYALKYNNLEMLKLLFEHGCPRDFERICYIASENNGLETLMYAHGQGYPLLGDICFAAAFNNNLEMLIYARNHGCGWDERVL